MEGETPMFAQVMIAIVLSVAGFLAIGLGARLLWHKGSPAPRQVDSVVGRQEHQRLETAMESMAIEVERISESQRFMVSLLGSRFPNEAGEGVKELAAPRPVKRTITP